MAPEQISGGTKNEQTDVFGLGAILFNLLSGKTAFSGSLEKVLRDTLVGSGVDSEECRLK